MKKYSFHLTKQENMEFCVRVLWEQQRLRPLPWLLILFVCILEAVWSPGLGLMLAVLWLLLILVVLVRNYFLMKKTLCENGRTMWVENGMLKLEAELYAEISCSAVRTVRVTPHLLMLGCYQAKRQPAWYPMPLRAFADRQEREAFLASIQDPGRQPEAAVSDSDGPEEEKLRITFWVDEEKWVRVLTDVTELVRAGTLPIPRKKGSVFFGVSAALLVFALAAGCLFPETDRIFLAVCLTIVLIWLLLFKNKKENPEKKSGGS